MPQEILDSEDDGAFDDDDHQRVPTSGELRQLAIDTAHKALIASSSALPSPGKRGDSDYGHNAIDAAVPDASSKTAREKDIFDFDQDGDDEPASPLPPPPKKRGRALTAPDISPENDDDDSDLERGPKPKKRQTAKKQRSKTTPIPIIELSSEDEYGPKPRAKATPRGKKPTRSNTGDQDLLPPLSKPKRRKKDLTKELEDYLLLPVTHDGASGNSGISQQRAFMIDMTHEDLVLPTQKKREYDGTIAANPAVENINGTPVLDSTLPDPPEVYMTMFEEVSTGVSVNLEHDGYIPPPVNPIEDTTVKPPFSPPFVQPKKRRSKTDTALTEFGRDQNMNGGHRIASEWRVAKGRAMQDLSDKPKRDSPLVDDALLAENAEASDSEVVKKAPRKPKEKKEPAARKKGKKSKEDVVVDKVVDSTDVGDLPSGATASNRDKKDSNPVDGNVMETGLVGPGQPPVEQVIQSSGLKKRGPHSPIREGKVPYRVGLSKRARIEPLLRIRRK